MSADALRYRVGAIIEFPLARNRYRIVEVDGDRVTFCSVFDDEDCGSESVSDLDACDVRIYE